MSKSYQQIPLTQFIERIQSLRNQLSSEAHLSTWVSSKEIETLEIWSFTCTKYDALSAKSWTYNYLDLILDELSRVDLLPKIHLDVRNLSAYKERVTIDLEWSGPFEGIELLTIPGIARHFWKVTCTPQESPLSLNVMRYFLYLQTSVAWGENELAFGGMQDGRLTANLQILQASSQKPPIELPISEIGWQDVSDYIVEQTYPNYLKTSRKLELKLNDELERRIKYVERGQLESKYVEQLHEWIDTLSKLRQAYLETIS
jgi:hypothetical protein